MTEADPGWRLGQALILTGTFLLVEVIAGMLSGSLALLADAGHVLTDGVVLMLALQAGGPEVRDRRRTPGHQRAVILGAAVIAGVLSTAALGVVAEAYWRLQSPVPVQTTVMLALAVLGLGINVISARLAATGREGNPATHAAYLELRGDVLGPVAVIGGALLIRFTGELWLDPLLGALVGIWVVPRVWALLAASMTGAVNAAFQQVDLNAFRRELAALPGVTEVQALHVWSATRGVHSVTVHLVGAEVNRDLVVKVHEIAAVHGMPYVIMRIEPAGLHAGDGDGLARQ